MPDPALRDRDPEHLHPVFRAKVAALEEKLACEKLPFKLFEGFRSPQRQQYLYAQGRTAPGSIVTRARPWLSNHQYGVAADFVLFEKGRWSWDDTGERAAWWDRLHDLARELSLTPLSFERPHLEMLEVKVRDLRAGRYPPGGDRSWAECLEQAVCSWPDPSDAPPLPDLLPQRPGLEEKEEELPSGLPGMGSAGWHACFGGREWRYDARGVYTRDFEKGAKPLRTRGKPITCGRIRALYSKEIARASRKHGVPPWLIVMTIATETAFARDKGFTGPVTFRWEPHVEVSDISPPVMGDYSAGPMQVLAGTARWLVKRQGLDYDPFVVAPIYHRRPAPPEDLPLYEPAVNIDIGTACIKERWRKTGDDPILVAAAYNSGGIYKSGGNPWRLRTAGDHLDRASQWYGDACAVIGNT